MTSHLVDKYFRSQCEKLGFDCDIILKRLSQEPVQSVIITYVFSLIKQPIQSAYLAGAIATRELYLQCPLTIKEYAETFQHLLREDVYNFTITHHEYLQSQINFEEDFNNLYFSIATFINTYLSRLHYKSEPKEIPQFALLRIAIGQFCNDPNPLDSIVRTYQRYSSRELIPSSPTIFNQGFRKGASVSCLIYTNADMMKDILAIIEEAGMASANNAGLGIDFSLLRHSEIGNHGKSQGLPPLLKIWDDLVAYITQGGRRPGAATASTRDCHIDMPEFIQMKDPTNEDQVRVNKLNLSLQISDLFMKRVESDGEWTLFCPGQTPELNHVWGREFEKRYIQCEALGKRWTRYQKYLSFQTVIRHGMLKAEYQQQYLELQAEFSDPNTIPRKIDTRVFEAKKLYKILCEVQSKTGGPYVNYFDSINRKNALSHIGPVRSTNLCQEITIPAVEGDQTGSCNLMSASLKEMVKPGETKFNFSRFAEVITDGIVALNRVIDNCGTISEKVMKSNRLSRPLGLGVSGFADMLHRLRLTISDPQNIPLTPEGVPDYSEKGCLRRTLNPEVDRLNWMIWSCMYYSALKASMEEAKKHGPCDSFQNSPAARGQFQFHFWQQEEAETGRTYTFRLYPAEPDEWMTGVEKPRSHRYEIGPKWLQLIEDIKKWGLRNLLVLSVQPTASTAQVVGNTESVEFHMGNLYLRKVLAGDYPVMNTYCISDLESLGIWNKRTYDHVISKDGSILHIPEDWVRPDQVEQLRFIKELYPTMWEIPQKIMVDLAAQRQVCVDQSQSMNIYIKYPTPEQVSRIHMYTWKKGLKTGMYYLRTEASEKMLKIGKTATVQSETGMKLVSEIADKMNKSVKIKGREVQEKVDNDLKQILESAQLLQEEESKRLESIRDSLIEEQIGSEVPMCTKAEGCVGCT